MYKVAFCTLGCKVNIYESNALMNSFEEKGFEIVDFSLLADVYIINTCSVTNNADAKSRKMIHKAIKQNKEAIIVVMGCFSQTNKKALEMDGVDILLGNGNKGRTIELVMDKLSTKTMKSKHVEILDILKAEEFESLKVTTFDHTRAFIKIEDGCNNFCSYCIIPFARGPVRSKPHAEVIEELKRVTNEGYKEIVLAGIHTGRYQSGEYGLSDLIEMILKEVPKLERLRLSSIEINEIDDKLLDLMSKSEVLANHLHLPLQSGTNKILELMNRKYDEAYFLDKIKKIRSIRPNISITTDVIVGFPYETQEDFEHTVEFIKMVNFAELHVFPFSPRSGTKAYFMPQIDGNLKKERVNKLLELSKKLNYSYNQTFINQQLDMIVETKFSDSFMVGHTSNYLKVLVPYNEKLVKKRIMVKIIKIEEEKIYGEVLKN